MEASAVKDLDISALTREIKSAKKALGINYGGAHVIHNNYESREFTLAIIDRDTHKTYLKTFDKNPPVTF